jgi:hypothetical protein
MYSPVRCVFYQHDSSGFGRSYQRNVIYQPDSPAQYPEFRNSGSIQLEILSLEMDQERFTEEDLTLFIQLMVKSSLLMQRALMV